MTDYSNTNTAVDIIVALVVPTLYDSPVILEGYDPDEVFSPDAYKPSESVMGVDGHACHGLINSLTKIKFKFAPNSPSLDIFQTWQATQRATSTLLPGNVTITMPSQGMEYQLTNGALSSMPLLPAVKKVVQSSEFEVTFEAVDGYNI